MPNMVVHTLLAGGHGRRRGFAGTREQCDTGFYRVSVAVAARSHYTSSGAPAPIRRRAAGRGSGFVLLLVQAASCYWLNCSCRAGITHKLSSCYRKLLQSCFSAMRLCYPASGTGLSINFSTLLKTIAILVRKCLPVPNLGLNLSKWHYLTKGDLCRSSDDFKFSTLYMRYFTLYLGYCTY